MQNDKQLQNLLSTFRSTLNALHAQGFVKGSHCLCEGILATLLSEKLDDKTKHELHMDTAAEKFDTLTVMVPLLELKARGLAQVLMDNENKAAKNVPIIAMQPKWPDQQFSNKRTRACTEETSNINTKSAVTNSINSRQFKQTTTKNRVSPITPQISQYILTNLAQHVETIGIPCTPANYGQRAKIKLNAWSL